MKKNSSTGRHARECLFPVGNPGASAPRQRPAIVPFFLPFAGCPHRCLFCAQDKQTGHTRPSDCLPYPQALANLLSELETHHMERTASRPIELAFYGGTFTALPERLQMEYLALAMQAKEKGIVCRVRCSTRPDALRPDRLQALRHAGLDLVELGIQSFHTEALLDVQRGYNGDRAREGCRLIKESGLKLGIQLLPGMPGSTPQRFSEDVEEALAFSPSCLRFYPCLVVDGTPLAERWRMGQYAPWELDTTITTLGKALASAWARRIPVIRLSLAPERELDESVLAGPRHPALGNIIQSEALFETVRSHFALNGFLPPDELFFPQYCQGFFSGHKGSLLPRWEKLGIQPSSIQWVEGEYASLRWNKPLEEVLS
ncbi:radical SAM protein [Bilophila wadsworthia]|nr:radical SAM protein [Bilophila wadsworthia]MCB8569777.1 radical SAM protein [Bilophila wadsworthia]MCC2713740.1 radical SAM protein [Bilophila wadsworthia]